jgi:predicted DCC family thiol-disulfide oxidoreductase YuxK
VENTKKIIFYDGECGLCQRSISFLARADKRKIISYAPINGKTYLQVYNERDHSLSTVRFLNNGNTFEKGDALIEILSQLSPRFWLLSALLKCFPSRVRDRIYDLIANQRNKVSCTLMTKDERFLD